MKTLLPWVCLMLLWTAQAAAQSNTDERASIVLERQRLNDRFALEERACANRFAVTACIDDVRARRRAELAPLRERELRLDQADRAQRAQARRSAVAQKQAAAASRPAAPPSPPQLRLREPMPAASGALSRGQRLPDTGNERAAAAAARARESEQRRQDIEAAQRRVQQREAERQASGKNSAPLPLPELAASTPKR